MPGTVGSDKNVVFHFRNEARDTSTCAFPYPLELRRRPTEAHARARGVSFLYSHASVKREGY